MRFIYLTDYKVENFVKTMKMCDALLFDANYMQIYDNIIRIKMNIYSKSFQEFCNKFINLKEKVMNLL